MDELARWETISSRPMYENPWMRVREDAVIRPDGSAGIYGVVTLGSCVGMLPFVDDDHVLLVRQWRYITQSTTWEMPTGGMHADEAPEQAAQRELAEECGVQAGRLTLVNRHVTSKSVVDETAYLFVAHDLAAATAQADETEFIVREVVPFRRALGWALDGTIIDSMTIIALLLAARTNGH